MKKREVENRKNKISSLFAENQSISITAGALGLSRTQLHRWMKKHHATMRIDWEDAK